jgi:hypothetical protein
VLVSPRPSTLVRVNIRFGSKADMCGALGDVSLVPIADILVEQPLKSYLMLFRAALAIRLACRHAVRSTVCHLTFLRTLFKTRLL